jgi:hypothetical protein
MSHPLISRSPDLQRLQDEGYELEISDLNYLLIHNVPYVTPQGDIKRGVLASTLHLAGDRTDAPDTHVVLFAGDQPCFKDGKPITAIQHAVVNQAVSATVKAALSFSNKPPGGYSDYFAKMTRYANVISDPARSIDPGMTAQTFGVIETQPHESVFAYMETASSRVGIAEVTRKLESQKIGIVGLGGTGSYVLDFVSKTPAKEIHLFDRDLLLHHNAFRAPGAASIEQLRKKEKKVSYFHFLYSRMHTKIVAHDCYIDEDNVEQLHGLDFVFLCADKGWARKVVSTKLQEWGIPFVDVGIGVHLVKDGSKSLVGIVRTTTSTKTKVDHFTKKVSFGDDEVENEYVRNIQICELNALNAAFAVIKWKKLAGFYQDLLHEHDSTYTINVNMLLSEDIDET